MGMGCSGEGRRSGRRRMRTAGAVLASAALAVGIGASASAAGAAVAPEYRVEHVCGASSPGTAACAALRLVSSSLTSAELQANAARQAAGAEPARENKNPFPGYLTPQDLHAAYSLPDETAAAATQTIAVIDAYDDPTAEADLEVYDEEFGLPACTSANGCFRKVNEDGQPSPLPPKSGEWAGEISIDVQMAHAVCEGCRVLLVEAKSPELTDLGAGVDAAVALGATEISNSYTAPEESSIASFYSELNASYYDHPGVVVAAAAGDCGYLNEACLGEAGAANFPADSPEVVARGRDEPDPGKGSVEQQACGTKAAAAAARSSRRLRGRAPCADFADTGCGTERSVADVAAIGDPNTGVDVYDSTPEGNGEPTGWTVFGGTSVASPIVAAELGLAGGSHGVAVPAATLYSHLGDAGDLYDVVSGSNGSCGAATSCQAATGYDGPDWRRQPDRPGRVLRSGQPGRHRAADRSRGSPNRAQTLGATAGSWTNSPTSTTERVGALQRLGRELRGDRGRHRSELHADGGRRRRDHPRAGNCRQRRRRRRSCGLGGERRRRLRRSEAHRLGAEHWDHRQRGHARRRRPGRGHAGRIRGAGGEVHGALLHAGRSDRARRARARAKISLTTPVGTVTSKAKFTPTLLGDRSDAGQRRSGHHGHDQGRRLQRELDASASTASPRRSSRVSAKKLKVKVPAGAGAGPVAVTNTSAPTGTVFSASSFTP